ncbi:hypothetical protein L1987_86916 [Smallanthus sonchifolius]|uniref:Uncharacterized protein n=1 Tax=Smallanthus sonchifolius TaxID=185202 RepID=A0ACB8Y0Q0_9ASTR|nr:hypothetical protein L1987_86916 [Smallanthus sonchifolius]
MTGRVGNGTVFAGFPSADLKTAIETAGDVNQMSGRVDLVGTQFGVGSRDAPMPSNISLVNDGFVCPTPSMQGTRVMNTAHDNRPTPGDDQQYGMGNDPVLLSKRDDFAPDNGPRPIPNPLPCGDHCGVSLNWHLLTDYHGGWSARITLFNWDDTSFADWFVVVELDKSAPGFEKAYSFNASSLEVKGVNDTIFMQGLPGLNYLVGAVDGNNPKKDPRLVGDIVH